MNFTKLGRELVIQGAMRLGTIGAVWLVAQGLPHDAAGQLEVIAGIGAGLAYDYLMIRLFRKEKA